MATYTNGQGGKVTIGVTDLDVVSWSFNPGAETADTTNTGSGGYANSILQLKRGTGTVTCNLDTTTLPQASPPDIIIGTNPTELKLYIGATGKSYTFGANTIITSTPITNPAVGLVSYTFDFETIGSWTDPT